VILPYPPAGRSRIRVKAFALILDERGDHHAVARMSTTEQPAFHRPLGGTVERGERSADAVVREIAEALGATLVEPELLGVLENIFTLEGETRHEVVFVYAGRLAEREVVPSWVEWRPVEGWDDVPLLPVGLQELLDAWLSRGSGH